jgi:ubiquinone/menaquinone biosynthesis C-methylase UbiE
VESSRAKAVLAGVFDRAAATYDQVGVPFFTPAGAALVAAADLRPGERVLDVGCGRGSSLLPAAEAVGPAGRVTGLDLAPGMVAAARAEAERRGLRHVEVRVGDAEDPDLPPGSVDAVLAGLVLFFLPDPAAAVRRYARLLRPGGRLAVSTFAESTPQDEAAYRRLLSGVLALLPPAPEPGPDDPPPPERRLRTRESLLDLVGGAGFTDVRFVERDFPVEFDTPRRLWDWAWSHGMRGLLESVPADRLDEARAAFLAAAEDVRSLTYRVRFTTALTSSG